MTPADVYGAMSIDDVSEVASDCFQQGNFDEDGELACNHGRWGIPWDSYQGDWAGPRRMPECEIEYLCEIMAAEILMPSSIFWPRRNEPEEVLMKAFDVEAWAVRFRRALGENT